MFFDVHKTKQCSDNANGPEDFIKCSRSECTLNSIPLKQKLWEFLEAGEGIGQKEDLLCLLAGFT